MSEPVLSRKRQGAQDAVDTLETFEAFEAFDKHGLPAFVRGVDAEALYFFLALFRTGTLPRAAEQLGISLSSANRMLAKLRTYWDDPLFVRSGFLMQPTTAAKRRYDKVLSLMHVLEDLRRDDELDPRTLSRTVRTACYDNAFALCIASIFADFTARMCGCAPRRPMNISLIICVRICSIWCSLPGRDSTQIFPSFLRHHFVWKRRTATRLCPRQRPNSHSTRGAQRSLSFPMPRQNSPFDWAGTSVRTPIRDRSSSARSSWR